MYGNAFTGFIKCFILYTCQYLVCPFLPPKSSNSGWTWEQYELDNKAMKSRTRLVKFDREFKDCQLSFDYKDWAACLLYMAENYNNM